MLKRLLRKVYFARWVNPHAARLHARLRPPPWQRPNMEFDYDVWNGISSLHGDSGRQIGENNTGPDLYRECVDTEHRVSNFDGSRRGLEVNMTALKHVMAVWHDTLQFATLLRERYISLVGLTERRFDLRQGYFYSKMAAALVAFQVRRRRDPLSDHALPPLEVAFFTLGVGPFMVVRSLLEKGDLAVLAPGPLPAEELYRLADESGSLVTPAGKGCAGSRKLITEFLDVMMNGSHAGKLDSADAQRAIDAIGDWDAFRRYLFVSSRIELYVKIARSLIARLLLLARSAGALRVTESEAAEAALANTYLRGPLATDDDLTVLANGIEILLTLLDARDGGALRRRIADSGLLRPGAQASREQFAQAFRDVAGLFAPLCQTDLEEIAAALEQPPGPRVGPADLLTRCGGPTLASLVESLATHNKPDMGVRVRPFDLERDLAELQRWLHMDYARFWGLREAPPEKIARLYAEQLRRPGYRTLIGEDARSGERCFLLEAYVPQDDELARHYPARTGDLGFHILMAPARVAQSGFTPRMLQAVHEVLFANPKTKRIVAEPDVRNLPIYRRLLRLGYVLGPIIQLPSKTSRLVFLERGCYLEPAVQVPARRVGLRWHRTLGAAHIFHRRVRDKLDRLMGRVR